MTHKLLIVDDEIAFLFALKKLLESENLEVDTAETVDQAMYFLSRRRYDAVVADLRLTGTLSQEGLLILEFVKTTRPDTKVILMTGYGSPEVMQEAYDLGADYYFEKPVPVEKITNALKEMGVPS